jgi:catechol 2,3-dioxygenase-like lactoylglutathione lyase family enzyme
MEHTAQVTSSVLFVSELGRSVAFYCDVFACEVAIQEQDAALLLAPGGFQIYLVARGGRDHPTGGIGHGFLTWATESPEGLDHFAQALQDRGHYVDTHVSGGVRFVEGHDPDGIRVVVAHPSPRQHPRSMLDSRFYN